MKTKTQLVALVCRADPAQKENERDELFPRLTKASVKNLKWQAEGALRHVVIAKVISPKDEVFLDTLRCMLHFSRIIHVPEYHEADVFNTTPDIDSEKFQLWRAARDSAQMMAGVRDGKDNEIKPEHLLAANRNLVLQKGQEILDYIKKEVVGKKTKELSIMVASPLFVNTVPLYLASLEGSLTVQTRMLEPGEMLYFVFKDGKMRSVASLQKQTVLELSKEAAERALIADAQRRR